MPEPVGRDRLRDLRTIVSLVGPYIVFAVLKRVVSLPRLAGWAWRPPAGRKDERVESSVARAVVVLRNRFGWDRGDCLQGSLAMYRVLSRAGAHPTLVVGVRRAEGRVTGHAWVEIEGMPVGEPASSAQGFVPVASFGAGGMAVAREAHAGTPDAAR